MSRNIGEGFEQRERQRRSVSAQQYLQWTRWAIWALTVIVVTGAAVRLTGSGLGCSDWPNCTEDRFVAKLEYHALIEFVNRLFTGVVALAVIFTVLGSLFRVPRRRDLTGWSLGLVAGVIAQVILGALLVRTELDPRFTMGHFLLSMVLLWNAVVLHHHAGSSNTRPPQALISVPSNHLDPGRLPVLVRLTTAMGAVVLVSGTIVTGSGPHSGSEHAGVAERLPFVVREVTRVHSILALVLIGLVALVYVHAHQEGLSTTRRRAAVTAALLVGQAIIGYGQYFLGVPVLMVGVHVTLASLGWINLVRLHLSSRVPTLDRSRNCCRVGDEPEEVR